MDRADRSDRRDSIEQVARRVSVGGVEGERGAEHQRLAAREDRQRDGICGELALEALARGAQLLKSVLDQAQVVDQRRALPPRELVETLAQRVTLLPRPRQIPKAHRQHRLDHSPHLLWTPGRLLHRVEELLARVELSTEHHRHSPELARLHRGG